jgi:hypothetical protein
VRSKAFALAVIACLLCIPSAAHAAPLAGTLTLSAVPFDLAKLQRGSDECAYCHLDDAAGVYGTDRASYTSPSNHSHSGAQTPCLACHVAHGERGMGGAVAEKRLRVRAYQPELVVDLAGGDAQRLTDGTARATGWDARDLQVTAFCTSCHPVYAATSTQTIQVTQQTTSGVLTMGSYHDHPMRLPLGRDGLRISAKASTGCAMCHGAGAPGSGAGSFPHTTPGYPYFLLSAPDASATPSAPLSRDSDGVCLRCHRWPGGGIEVDW